MCNLKKQPTFDFTKHKKMNSDKSNNDQNKERLKDLQNDLIIHYHQDAAFYERRTYIMFFVISGFGLYACLDLYKSMTSPEWITSLLISSALFVLPLLISIISNEMARKKSMYKAECFQNFDETNRKGAGKYVKIENGLKLAIGACYLIGVIFLAFNYYIRLK